MPLCKLHNIVYLVSWEQVGDKNYFQKMKSNVFIYALYNDFKSGHHQKLRQASFAKNCSKRNENGSRAKIGHKKAYKKKRNFFNDFNINKLFDIERKY